MQIRFFFPFTHLMQNINKNREMENRWTFEVKSRNKNSV